MNERRTSIGNRVISLVLALVMVFGMLPTGLFAFTAKAVTTDPQNTAERAQAYAEYLLGLAFDQMEETKPGFPWEGESKTKASIWLYYNGLMIDAMLTLGADAGNDETAKAFAELFYNTYISSSGNIIERDKDGTSGGYNKNELDSVEATRALFDIWAAESDSDKKEKYAKAIQFVFSELEKQQTIAACGNNFYHKQEQNSDGEWVATDTWTDYPVALDGLYMAHPFLMECAKAIDESDLALQYSDGSDVTSASLYEAEYERIIWIAKNMATEYTADDGKTYYLYNHGVKSDGTTKNGQHWGRAIGWYAMTMVDLIDLIPDDITVNGNNFRQELIGYLPKLFDGMLIHQDESGMWYNMVNYGPELVGTDDNETPNKLETSGSAMMAYALMKAYNNGWVDDTKYGQAGLNAFNAIILYKLNDANTEMADIWLQSGVSKEAATYLSSSSYAVNEGKGVGPVLLAASLAGATSDKLASAGVAESSQFVGKVVSESTTASLGQAVNTNGVEIVMVSNDGVESTITSGFTITADTSTVGTKTGTVTYNNIELGTIDVVVTDPSDPVTANGTIGGGAGGDRYERVTSGITTNQNYIITKYDSGGSKYAAGISESSLAGYEIAGYDTLVNGYYKIEGDIVHWQVDSEGRIFTVTSSETYYLSITGTGAADRKLVESADITDASKFTFTYSGTIVSAVPNNQTGRKLVVDSGGLKTASVDDDKGVMFYRLIPSGNAVVLSVEPNTVNVGVDETYDLTSEGTTVTVDGEKVTLADCTISWASSDESVATVENGTITGKANGTATVTATLSKAPVDGTATALDSDISVNITVNVSTTCEHTPDGDGVISSPTCEAQGYTTYTCSKCGSSYNTDYVDATGHSWGEGVVTEPTCTAGGYTTYTCSNCSDTKTDNETEASGHSYVSGVCSVCGDADDEYVAPGIESITAPNGATDKATVVKGSTLQLTAATVGGATISWSSGNDAIATVSDTGLVTGVSAGTVTITATVVTASRAVGDSATFEVTVYESSDVEGDWVLIEQTETTGDKTYELYSSATNDSVPAGNYIIVYSADGTTGKALKNEEETLIKSSDPDTPVDVTIADNKITSDINAYTIWTLSNDNKFTNGKNGIQSGNDKILNESGDAAAVTFEKVTESTGWAIKLKDKQYLCYSNNNFTRKTEQSSTPTDLNIYLFKESDNTSSGTTTDTKWAKMTGESITVTAGTVTDDKLLDMVENAISIQQSEQETDHTDATDYTGTAYTLTWANDTEPDADTAGEYTATVTVPFVITTDGTAAPRETPATLGTVTVTVVAAVECDHSYNTVVTDPTCTEQGYTTYTCSKCNDTYVADYVDAKGHTEVTDDAVAATCTTTGLTEGKHCSVCNTVIVAQTVTEKLGHSYSASVTTAPGCETTGVRTYTCTVCAEGTEGHSYTEEIAATGHSYTSAVTKEATCTAAGIRTYTCANDSSHTYTEEIAANGHTEGDAVQENVVAATCCAAGSYDSVVYCSVCNTELSRTQVTEPATGNHTYGDDGVCTTDGCGATKPNTNVTVTAGKTPSETQFVVATELKEGQLYVIANADSSGTGFTHRAAYWNENQSSWTSQFNGGDDEDPVLEIPGDGESVYTLIDGKKVSLWYWDADKSSFYLSTDSSKYLNCEDSSGAVATLGTSSTEYTVDLTGKTITIKDSDTNYKYLKIEKNGTLNAKNSGNTWLLTPVMTGSDVETKYLVEISVADQTVEVGKSVTPTVTITVKDENGNTVSTTATGTFEFASADTAKATGGSSLTGVAATDTPVSVTATLKTLTIGGVTANIDTAGSITDTFNLTVTEATDGWELFTGTTIEEGWYIIVETDSNSYDYAMTNNDTDNGTVTAVTIQNGKVVFADGTAPSNIIWTIKAKGEKWQVYNDANYVKDGDAVLQGTDSNSVSISVTDNTTDKYQIKTADSKWLAYEADDDNWVRQTTEYSVYLYKWTGSSAPGSSSGDDSGDDDTGSDTPVTGSQYVHNFTTDNKTSDFYTITGSLSSSKGSTTYNGLTLTQCLKMESSTSISFTAPSEGTLTLVFGGETSASGKTVKIDGTAYTVDSDGTLTITLAAGSHTVTKGDAINLFYMAYAPTVAQNSITLTGEETLYIGGVDEDDLTIEVVYGGEALESGYELTVKSNDETVVKVENTDGKYYIVAQKAGLASITATLTKVGDTDVTAEAITDTLTVAVLEPSIQLDDDRTMVVGQSYTFTPSVAYEDGDISDYTLILSVNIVNADGTTAETDAVTATLNDDGTITLKAVKATADETYVTVTATLTKIGDNTVTGYSDSMQVEVAAKTIVKVDMSPSTITMGNDESLTDLQNYEKDVTLTFHYNDGTSVTKTVADGITINNENVTIGTVGTYYAPVTYVDAEMGVNYAKDLVVTILDATQINAEGVAAEVEVSYVLDTDGTIEGDSKYLIVVGTNALMVNPNADGNHAGISNTDVTISDDGTIATVGSNAILTEWHFAGRGESGNNQTYTLVSNKDANGETTYMLRSDSKFLGTSKSSTITLEPVDASKGQYVIRLASGRYLMCNSSGTWSRSDSSTEASEATTVTLYKRTETPVETHTVAFELEGTGVACVSGVHTLPNALGVGLSKTFTGSVKLDGVAIDLSRCEIEWSVEDTDYLSVNGGTVTGVKDSGDASYKVYAKLISVDGMTITAQDNSAYLLETVVIKVADVEITYQLVINGEETDTMCLPLGEQPDLTQVQVKVYQTIDGVTSYVETYDYEDLIFNVADSELDVDAPGSSASIAVLNRDSEKEIATLTIKVGSNATQYRETAEEYAGYPDDGAVRLDKVATGVNFMQTGIAKIQLMVAGVSTNTPVDVVLIVDVSNSMGWDINRSSGSNDQAKIPTDGADGTDKLDNAMSAASDFADILLKNNVSGSASNNTISFVTFAGNDTDRAGADADCLDAMQTVFVGSDDLTEVKTAFEGTKFTQFDNQSNGKVKYTLQIGGGTAKENAGGTNYDYAFLQGQDAVTELKAQWSKANGNKSYDESGRELHVIFMTDGIPSHYNGYCYETGSQTSGFTEFSGKDAAWLAEVQKVNQNATDLYAMVTDIHTVGFDLDAGGIGDEADAIRLLSGLVENRKLECALAEESATLTQFFTELAESLAFAGTSAIAVDGVSTDFELWTKPIDVNVDNDTTDAEDIEPTIEILSRRLVLYSDIGSTLNIINEKGVTVSVELDANNIATYLGAYVDEEAQVIEKVEFGTDTDNNTAYSSLLDGDIWDDTAKTITGKYFTYDVANKKFTWNISDITDREISLNYYGYLVGSGKQSGDTVKDFTNTLIATNSEATISYVDIDGKIANRTFPVPYMSFGKALVTFRFYIVNEDGLFVNNADVTFDSPANRIFLSERATYQLDVGDTNIATTITAKAALETAKITGKPLFDDEMAVTVTPGAGGSVVWTIDTNLNNYKNLQIYQDLSGDYTDIVIDIPVVGTLGNADSKMFDSNVVIDFSNPVQWDARAAAEAAYDGVAVEDQISTIELVGFAEYDANADLTAYLAEKTWATSITTAYGTYEVVTGTDEIKFTPSAMLSGVDHVFAVFKFSTQAADATDATMDYHYLYKHVTVVPASVMYYETTGNMAGAFTTSTEGPVWSAEGTPDTAMQNLDDGNYGYDASYAGFVNYSGNSYLYVENTDPKGTRPTVKFSFTGTGIDIISKTGPNDGMIKMTLTNRETGVQKSVLVINKGTEDLYQIPVLSVENLDYGTYDAEIIVFGQPYGYNGGKPAYGGQFCFDAIRVYGGCLETEVVGYKTNADGTKSNVTVGDLYAEAGESSPQILEIRDILLSSNDFGSVTLDGTTINGAVYIDGNLTMGEGSSNFNDYDKIGPNNEVYLSKGQAIAFKLKVADTDKLPETLAIGLKSVKSAVDAEIIIVAADGTQTTYTYSGDSAIKTSTAMFYDLLGGEDAEAFLQNSSGFTVVIRNIDDDDAILSVTDLKIAYGETVGSVETVVDSGLETDALNALTETANVASVTCNNVVTTVIDNVEVTKNVAYAMQTTTLVVVTGQAAQNIKIMEGETEIAATATFVDTEDGARVWRVLVRMTEVGEHTLTVFGVNSSGNVGEISQTITLDVQLFQSASTSEQTAD